MTPVYQHELPNAHSKSIKAVLVEYGPGGYSPDHTHFKSALIYATVFEGAIRSQFNEGPVTGESFSELPGDRHDVSANEVWRIIGKLELPHHTRAARLGEIRGPKASGGFFRN